MLKSLRFCFLGAAPLFLLASPVHAIVDAQLQAGQKMGTFENDAGKTQDLNATEIVLSAHVDPIPLIPVSGGLFLITDSYQKSADGKVVAQDKLYGASLGVEVSAWLPLSLFNLNPYAKLGYIFSGAYASEKSNYVVEGVDLGKVTTEYKSNGTRLALGLRWSPIAIVSGLFEIAYADESLEHDSTKISGVEVSSASSLDLTQKSYSVLLGVQVGI